MRAVVCARCETEVAELRVAVPGNEDVVWLDVAVQDPGVMGSRERIGDADEQLDHLSPAAFLDARPRAERAAVYVFVTRKSRPSNEPASCTVMMCG
jgi:hypothetical protein